MTRPASANHQSANSPPEEPVCGGCPEADKCRSVWSLPNRGPFNSVGILLSSILAFLLPVILAIVASGAARAMTLPSDDTRAGEIAAAAIGLMVGIVIAWRLMPLVKKHFSRP